ncbi:hypothetical protein CR513_00749, partial [Mucuna pruriens]
MNGDETIDKMFGCFQTIEKRSTSKVLMVEAKDEDFDNNDNNLESGDEDDGVSLMFKNFRRMLRKKGKFKPWSRKKKNKK